MCSKKGIDFFATVEALHLTFSLKVLLPDYFDSHFHDLKYLLLQEFHVSSPFFISKVSYLLFLFIHCLLFLFPQGFSQFNN